MSPPSVFQVLRDALQQLKVFLDANIAILKPALQALSQMLPQIPDMLDQLIVFMAALRTQIQNLNVTNVPGLGQVATFGQLINTSVEDSRPLLPNEAARIDRLIATTDVLIGLPSLDQIRSDILSLIDAIVVDLNELKAS